MDPTVWRRKLPRCESDATHSPADAAVLCFELDNTSLPYLGVMTVANSKPRLRLDLGVCL
ncbi:hypothetical protein NEUTE1DRAFT_102986 [Neurospora tetrasperma FGSC 2508]|uniref:Uncharacterized protein n=1 Tax=Neurospora tetrasperma (strain FGSC 2508 / ATCC MYA-4615 / P0657) TaxID=510951 RepID=F8MU94_NEUT8|nr:uncharacterized protein NEUTE1DRAFT_102986 [Neurospora tetrasperma FGSC 2508]EGO55576.1 hypothetical protein NEUTE1DRAFT_102986 [Neurospora tetrasperma FGSC 2508]EGZ69181.1 hypothetical protein NEUTE2DRAFT_71497 [Neurospora tetrasperma FGSC 2509]